jgi:hypothetical protein
MTAEQFRHLLTRRRLLQGTAGAVIAGGLASLIGAREKTPAQPLLPGSTLNPIARENRRTAPSSWTSEFRLRGGDGRICGYATRTSVDRGEPVELKLAAFGGDSPLTTAIEVYRLGWYGGMGARLVHQEAGIPVQREQVTEHDQYGELNCRAWPINAIIPGSATAVTGLYLVKLVASNGWQSHIPIIVRDDSRARDLLVALPVNTWQAYNYWGDKSLYSTSSNDLATVAGHTPYGASRAVKVSFDRPYSTCFKDYNWPLHVDYPMIAWLERQGYDVAYTDDVGLHAQPEQLAPDLTRTLAITGHSEYWTADAFEHVEAAVDAGVNLASFSANTAYWQVRYEHEVDGIPRTLVCFKTVEGGGSEGSGRIGVNDYGPDANARGGPFDPLGPDGIAMTADDRPRYATTTRRDRGAKPGSEEAPTEGRVGPDKPENRLFGVLYVGDDDSNFYGLHVPPGEGRGGEFGAHPAWRHTDVPRTGVTIGENLVGWEWDAIPGSGTRFAASQPAGVKRLSETDPFAERGVDNQVEYIQDDGHRYEVTPLLEQGPCTHAVTYRRSSGAHVFASGTIQWSYGLAPHFLPKPSGSYEDAPGDSSDRRIQQATRNILADGDVHPATPEGVVLD